MSRRRAAPGAPEGGLVVDKPAGPTSHDVVAVARRALGQPRVGHTGTLDPLATGVLPLLLGRATRLAQFLASSDKTYLATIQFGQATSSYDAAGEPVGPAQAVTLDPVELEAALSRSGALSSKCPPPCRPSGSAGTAPTTWRAAISRWPWRPLTSRSRR